MSQPRPGHVTWTSPLGKTYDVPPTPVIEELPDPIPPSSEDTPDRTPADGPGNAHILEPEAQQAPRPPPPATVDEEEPPF